VAQFIPRLGATDRLHIFSWAVTPCSTLAKPMRHVQPMPERWREIGVSTDMNAPGALPALRF